MQCNLKTIRKVGESHSNYELLIHESPYVKYLAYDMKRDITPYCNVLPNPFKNPFVRQALDVAIDRRRLTDQLSTFAIPNHQPIPAFVFGFNPQLASAKHDLIYARQLLQQAGLAKGFDVTLHSRELLQETASLVQQQLQKINITVRIEILPDEEFFEKLNRRDSTFYLSRLGCPTGDVSDLLEMALHSQEISKHFGTRNSGGYENPKLDEAIERTAGIVNVDQRLKALQQVMLWIHQDRPWIPLYIDQEVFALERHYVWKPRNDAYILAQEIGVQ